MKSNLNALYPLLASLCVLGAACGSSSDSTSEGSTSSTEGDGGATTSATTEPRTTQGGTTGSSEGGETTTSETTGGDGAGGLDPDPAGYLHDHFIPQVMNAVLDANGIASCDVECTRYEQEPTAMYGFAKDGFPIYASRDEEAELPVDLDAYSGHTHVTSEFPDGTYRYHASESAVPNLMSCLSGVAVEQPFRYYGSHRHGNRGQPNSRETKASPMGEVASSSVVSNAWVQ